MIGKIVNEQLQDIIVSGYSEKGDSFYIFSPMLWWIYLKFERYYILLNSGDGNISIEESLDIKCEFDIEEEDVFTISSISKSDYGLVTLVDLIYDDNEKNLVKIGIQFDEESKYLLIDSLDVNGFVVENVGRNDTLKYCKSGQLRTIIGV